MFSLAPGGRRPPAWHHRKAFIQGPGEAKPEEPAAWCPPAPVSPRHAMEAHPPRSHGPVDSDRAPLLPACATLMISKKSCWSTCGSTCGSTSALAGATGSATSRDLPCRSIEVPQERLMITSWD